MTISHSDIRVVPGTTMPLSEPVLYEVEVTHVGDYTYACVAKTSDGDKPVSIPDYESKPEDLDIDTWARGFPPAQKLAAAQVYFDIWNFVDDSDIFRDMYYAFETASKLPSFGPTNTSVGTLQVNVTTNQIEVWNGTDWVRVG